MSKARKIGILLIIVGFFIPSVFYPFTRPSEEALFMREYSNIKPRLNQLVIVFTADDLDDLGDRSEIPYNFAVVTGIILIFTGIGFIALIGKKKVKE